MLYHNRIDLGEGIEKIYKDLVTYYTRYFHTKPIKMLSLHYHKLIGKIEEQKYWYT